MAERLICTRMQLSGQHHAAITAANVNGAHVTGAVIVQTLEWMLLQCPCAGA